ncbi:MAG: diadenosine tetraphosphate hydrolase [archaeon]
MEETKRFPYEKVIITDHFDVHQDWSVPIPGFFIIESRRKINSFSEFNEAEIEEFTRVLCKLRKGMKEVLKINGAYIFQREDSEEGFHLWVFPRHKWMEKFGRKVESVRPIIEYAKKNMNKEEITSEVKISVQKMEEFMKGLE